MTEKGMIWWTGLASWESDFFFQVASYLPSCTCRDNYLMCGESFMIRTALGVLKWLSVITCLPPMTGYGAIPYLFDMVCNTFDSQTTSDNKKICGKFFRTFWKASKLYNAAVETC